MFNILIVEDEVIQRQNLVSIASELGSNFKILEAGKRVFHVNGIETDNKEVYLVEDKLFDAEVCILLRNEFYIVT